jgi:hypothetical protein
MKIAMSKIPLDRGTFVLDIIKRRGMKQIGAGKYGSVFANAIEPTVIKVCRDEAYRSFIAEALKHQDNPWFPKIQSATEYSPKNEDPYLVVVMERLRKGSAREIDGALCLFDNQRFESITAMVQLLGLADMERMNHLSEVRRVLGKLFKSYGPDFHKGNIMFREAQAVIIDPIVSAAQSTLAITEPLGTANDYTHVGSTSQLVSEEK